MKPLPPPHLNMDDYAAWIQEELCSGQLRQRQIQKKLEERVPIAFRCPPIRRPSDEACTLNRHTSSDTLTRPASIGG